ncbi:hypothetical protein KJ596_00790 [Patescibacteria group bacterium]|nr:hypothetical protein [Patescibacteria group bacterium]MBU1868699.1 hypothetical protein [Patescibacteria group bacterium]
MASNSSATLSSLISVFGLGALISGIVVSWVKNKLEQNSVNKRRVRERRERQYIDFLNNLMGFRKGWEDKKMMKQFIWDVNTNATVSASDEVYRLANKYIESFDKKSKLPEPERQKIYARLVITMRNELNKMSGEPPTDLEENEIKVMQLD